MLRNLVNAVAYRVGIGILTAISKIIFPVKEMLRKMRRYKQKDPEHIHSSSYRIEQKGLTEATNVNIEESVNNGCIRSHNRWDLPKSGSAGRVYFNSTLFIKRA
jgi:hypothetical protein